MRGDTGGKPLRFGRGRPVSQVTEDFLARACGRLAAEGKRAMLLIWDNASWHVSGRVRARVRVHNRRVKIEGVVLVVSCFLPVKAPWLNSIELKWPHGKRAIPDPDRKLSGDEVIERVCRYFGCEQLDRLEQQVA